MKSLRVAALFLFIAPAVLAERSGGASMPRAQASDPRSEAVQNYQSGQRRLDKIAKMHEELKSAKDAKQAEKLQNNIRKQLENAAADFRRAIAKYDGFFQAHSELGFTLRKLGKYDESLAAYERALTIQPGYSAAIEYRAEAHLGLNRLDEARQAYTALYQGDRPRADVLLAAMKEWVTERRANPGDVPASTVAEFATWIERRDAVHQQNPSTAPRSADIRTW